MHIGVPSNIDPFPRGHLLDTYMLKSTNEAVYRGIVVQYLRGGQQKLLGRFSQWN